jgi:hypothetical protein
VPLPEPRLLGLLARVATVGVLCLQAALAQADAYDDREARLKSAGVDDELRPRIHRAIDDGARWLAEQVAADGALRGSAGGIRYQDTGRSALVALALVHARSPGSDEVARRVTKRLFELDRGAATALRSETYVAGLGGLLAAEATSGVPADDARDLARALVDGQQSSTAWWGYGLNHISAGRGPRPSVAGDPGRKRRALTDPGANLSTTQFAVLGLWGLSRRGVPVPDVTWRTHLEQMCRLQADDGSWNYGPQQAKAGYPNGTFMGVAGLLIAEAALAERDLHVDLRKAVAVARVKGLRALRRDVEAWFDQDAVDPSRRNPAIDYYGLYALEKACVFAGLERVGGESWYARGARLLLTAQDRDGGWGRTRAPAGPGAEREIATSFAVLFLTRSAERYGPTTPVATATPVTRPATPITPSEPEGRRAPTR